MYIILLLFNKENFSTQYQLICWMSFYSEMFIEFYKNGDKAIEILVELPVWD